MSVVIGRTYVFSVQTAGVQFALHTVSGVTSASARYSDGSVSGQGTSQVTLTVSANTPSVLYYQSEVTGNEALFGVVGVDVVTSAVASTPAATTTPAAPPSYIAYFYNNSASCATTPMSVVTTQAGVCFPNPFLPPNAGYIKYTAVNDTAVSGGGYSDSSCVTTSAPLGDILTGVCNPVVFVPVWSVRIDKVVPSTAPIVTATPTAAATTAPAAVTSTTVPVPTTTSPLGGDTFSVGALNLGVTAPEWVINGLAGSPAITLVRGRVYTFVVSTPNYLFAIHSVSGSTSQANRYDTGVTGQGSSMLVFAVPQSAPDSLFYQSELTAEMFGAISVISEVTTAPTNTLTSPVVTSAPTNPVFTSAPTATTAAAITSGNFTVSGMNLGITQPEWIINGVAGSPAITVVRFDHRIFFFLSLSQKLSSGGDFTRLP